MSTFFNKFLQEKASRLPEDFKGQLYLSAFGKHPGWNDHIEDIGIETETLAITKSLLYVKGIGGLIDSGVWDKLDAEKKISDFGHLFLWHRMNEMLLGLMWPSRDGKGRARYPMVICAHCVGLPLPWVLSKVLPKLKEVEKACVATESADAVRSILAKARNSLRATIEQSPPQTRESVPIPQAFASFVDHTDFEPHREGLLRILYQIKNQMSLYGLDWFNPKNFQKGVRAEHIRFPLAAASSEQAMAVWFPFLRTQIDSRVPILLVLPKEHRWCDAIVGEPSRDSLFCLKASPKSLPLASDIPFNLDDAFREKASRLLHNLKLDRGEGEISIFGHPQKSESNNLIPKEKVTFSSFMRDLFGSAPVEKVILVAMGLIASFVILVLLLRVVLDVVVFKDEESARLQAVQDYLEVSTTWKDLGNAYLNWYSRFALEMGKPQNRSLWQSDPHLRKEVLGLFEKAEKDSLTVDPLKITSAEGDLAYLLNNPPTVIQNPDIRHNLEAASDYVKSLRERLENWPELKNLETDIARYTSFGWTGPAAEIKKRKVDLPFDARLLATVDEVLQLSAEVRTTTHAWATLEKQFESLEETGDPLLKKLRVFYRQKLADSNDLASLAQNLAETRKRVAEIKTFVDQIWLRGIDLELFRRDPFMVKFNGVVTEDSIADWQKTAEKYRLLSLDEDPVHSLKWDEKTQQLKKDFKVLASLGGKVESRLLAGKLDNLSKDYLALQGIPKILKDLSEIEKEANNIQIDLEALIEEITMEQAKLAKPEEWLTEVKQRTIEGDPEINEEWKKSISLILGKETAKTLKENPNLYIEKRRSLEGLYTFLNELASATYLPFPLFSQAGIDPVLGQELAALAAKKRGQFLEQAFKIVPLEARVPQVTLEAFLQKDTAKKIKSDYLVWEKKAEAFVKDFTILATLLHNGYGLEGQVGKIYNHWKQSELLKEVKEAKAFTPILTQINLLQRVSRLSPAKAVIELASGSNHLAVSIAVWKRLSQFQGWPNSVEDLKAEQSILQHLWEKISSQIDDPARQTKLHQEFSSIAKEHWLSGTAHLDSREEAEKAFELMADFAVSESELNPPLKFNYLIYKFLQKSPRKLPEEEAASLRNAFLEEVWALDATVTKRPEFISFFEDLAALEPDDDKSKEMAELSAVGPGRLGWKTRVENEGEAVVYTWTDKEERNHVLKFIFAETKNGDSFYLADRETDIGLFFKWTFHQNNWKTLQPLMPLWTNRTGDIASDQRLGPRLWMIIDGALEMSSFWLIGDQDNNFLNIYPPGLELPLPSERHPMQYVPPRAATTLCESLACRLPTIEEWKAVYENYVQGEEKGNILWNRRDPTWGKKKNQVKYLVVQDSSWPDWQIFWPSNETKPKIQASAEVTVTQDDGVIWFVEVDEPKQGTFKHFIGNVAEYLYEPDTQTYYVVGASALSAKEVEATTPYLVNLDDARQGYADVGFRLAFSAPIQTFGQSLEKKLKTAPFLSSKN